MCHATKRHASTCILCQGENNYEDCYGDWCYGPCSSIGDVIFSLFGTGEGKSLNISLSMVVSLYVVYSYLGL